MKFSIGYAILIRMFILFFLTASAFAQDRLVYIGGFGTTAAQMQVWQQKASKRFKGRVEAYAFPSEYSGEKEVLADPLSQSLIRQLSSRLNRNRDSVVLVAHSSGSAIATEVAKRLRGKHKYVVLDGFTPTGLGDGILLSCWSVSGAPNQAAMQACGNAAYRQGLLRGCYSRLCRHFVLVNLNAAKLNLDNNNYKALAYRNLVLNFEWLP